jgi:hypothetical protein
VSWWSHGREEEIRRGRRWGGRRRKEGKGRAQEGKEVKVTTMLRWTERSLEKECNLLATGVLLTIYLQLVLYVLLVFDISLHSSFILPPHSS